MELIRFVDQNYLFNTYLLQWANKTTQKNRGVNRNRQYNKVLGLCKPRDCHDV